MANNNGNHRIAYLDVAKLIGLGLVCFCHIPYPEGNFHIWVYSFHMPLFFIVSGIFFNPEYFSTKKSVTQLLIPFVLFNIIACIIGMLIGAAATGVLKIPILTSDFITRSHYIIGPSWFLISLFTLRIYCGLVLRWLNNICLVVLSMGMLLILCITPEWHLWSVFSLGSTVLGLPFYLSGFYLKRMFLEDRYIGKWWLAIAALALSILALYNGQVGIHVHEFGRNVILFIVFGLAGSVLIVSMSRWVKVPDKILSVFMDGALFIICFHTLIFEYLILFWNKLTDDFSGNTVIEKIVVTAVTFIVSYPIILLMLRFTPFLLGKSKKIKSTVYALDSK